MTWLFRMKNVKKLHFPLVLILAYLCYGKSVYFVSSRFTCIIGFWTFLLITHAAMLLENVWDHASQQISHLVVTFFFCSDFNVCLSLLLLLTCSHSCMWVQTWWYYIYYSCIRYIYIWFTSKAWMWTGFIVDFILPQIRSWYDFRG